MTARVVITAAPTAEAMERVGALLALPALAVAGQRALNRGSYERATVSRAAGAMVAGWIYDVRYARPMPETTAWMIAAAIELAGIACRVEVAA